MSFLTNRYCNDKLNFESVFDYLPVSPVHSLCSFRMDFARHPSHNSIKMEALKNSLRITQHGIYRSWLERIPHPVLDLQILAPLIPTCLFRHSSQQCFTDKVTVTDVGGEIYNCSFIDGEHFLDRAPFNPHERKEDDPVFMPCCILEVDKAKRYSPVVLPVNPICIKQADQLFRSRFQSIVAKLKKKGISLNTADDILYESYTKSVNFEFEGVRFMLYPESLATFTTPIIENDEPLSGAVLSPNGFVSDWKPYRTAVLNCFSLLSDPSEDFIEKISEQYYFLMEKVFCDFFESISNYAQYFLSHLYSTGKKIYFTRDLDQIEKQYRLVVQTCLSHYHLPIMKHTGLFASVSPAPTEIFNVFPANIRIVNAESIQCASITYRDPNDCGQYSVGAESGVPRNLSQFLFEPTSRRPRELTNDELSGIRYAIKDKKCTRHIVFCFNTLYYSNMTVLLMRMKSDTAKFPNNEFRNQQCDHLFFANYDYYDPYPSLMLLDILLVSCARELGLEDTAFRHPQFLTRYTDVNSFWCAKKMGSSVVLPSGMLASCYTSEGVSSLLSLALKKPLVPLSTLHGDCAYSSVYDSQEEAKNQIVFLLHRHVASTLRMLNRACFSTSNQTDSAREVKEIRDLYKGYVNNYTVLDTKFLELECAFVQANDMSLQSLDDYAKAVFEYLEILTIDLPIAASVELTLSEFMRVP